MGRRLAAAFGAKGRRWIRGIGDRHHEVERQPRHRLDAGVVHEMGVVARPVILIVEPRVKHHRGNPGGDERIVVGVVLDFPVVDEFEVRGPVGLQHGHS